MRLKRSGGLVSVVGSFGSGAFAPNPLQAAIGNTIVWVGQVVPAPPDPNAPPPSPPPYDDGGGGGYPDYGEYYLKARK